MPDTAGWFHLDQQAWTNGLPLLFYLSPFKARQVEHCICPSLGLYSHETHLHGRDLGSREHSKSAELNDKSLLDSGHISRCHCDKYPLKWIWRVWLLTYMRRIQPIMPRGGQIFARILRSPLPTPQSTSPASTTSSPSSVPPNSRSQYVL